MGRGNETFGKKEVRAKKEKKKKEKEQKRQGRKGQGRDGNDLDSMIAYVDEFGKLSSTPPDLTKKIVINADEIEIGVPKTADEDPDSVHRGIVTFYNETKGFGFIKDMQNSKDVFVHVHALLEPIKENNKVTFDVAKGPKGLTAINVKIDRE
jgi:cold shock CspA family protein